MVKKKVNKFSIFRYADESGYGKEGAPYSKGGSGNLRAGKVVGNMYRAFIRGDVFEGLNDSHKIPHIDRMFGCRINLYPWGKTGVPEIALFALNNDISKWFDGSLLSWKCFADTDTTNSWGAYWKEDGGDFDSDEYLAAFIPSDTTWNQNVDIDRWIKKASIGDGDTVALLIKESEDANEDTYFTGHTTITTGTLPTACWRGDEFGGGDVYLNGIHASTPLYPIFEFVYEDDIAEQPTDFKLSPIDGLPEKMDIIFSESPDEDVQGYITFATLDTQLYDFVSAQWGWVDVFTTGAGTSTITCIGQAPNWAVDRWNSFFLIFTNGKNKGRVFTITDTSNVTGVLTLSETLVAGDLSYNDMFIIVRGSPDLNEVFAIETNRGYFIERAPDEDFEVYIKDFSTMFVNKKYNYFVQAIDNLGMGPRGDKSNIVKYVIPEINHAKDFNIASVTDDETGTSLDIYEEVYPAIYTVGLDNEVTTTPGTSTTGLKDKVKYEIETGEFRYLLDTYVTTLTAEWSAGTTISLDLYHVPKKFFRVGQKVCIIDRDAASPPAVIFDIRTITGIGDNSITVDAAPGHTFRINTSQIYPVKTFVYTKTGSKSGIIKARTINEEGFASPWQTPNTAPAPIDIPGIGSLKAGPTEAEKDSTDVFFNMNLSRPKDSVATITKYALDKDDGVGDTDYDEPVQSLTAYTSTGTKQPFAYIYDSNNIISPAFAWLWDYVTIGAVWNDRTIVGRTHDAGSPMDAMNAVGDIMYMGFERPNDGVYVQMVTSMLGMTFDKQYWDGSSWQTLTVTDGTVNMTQSGKIVWTPPSDWASSSVNSSDTLYFVRFTVTAITASTDFFILVPLELGNNFSVITVIDPTIIDLDAVFVDGWEKHQEEHPRRIYAKSGILGHMVKQGIKLIATFTLNGHSHNINDNYLSGFDASGVALFAGAANTDNRLDDLQILDNIIVNGRLVKFKDDAGTSHTGYLSVWGLPTRMEGMPVANWQINFIPDPNR